MIGKTNNLSLWEQVSQMSIYRRANIRQGYLCL